MRGYGSSIHPPVPMSGILVLHPKIRVLIPSRLSIQRSHSRRFDQFLHRRCTAIPRIWTPLTRRETVDRGGSARGDAILGCRRGRSRCLPDFHSTDPPMASHFDSPRLIDRACQARSSAPIPGENPANEGKWRIHADPEAAGQENRLQNPLPTSNSGFSRISLDRPSFHVGPMISTT